MRPLSVIQLKRFSSPLSVFFDSICFPLYLCSSFSSTENTSCWDPAVSLDLKHPTLLFLEKNCITIHHFREILAQMMRLHLTAQTFPMSRLLYFAAVSHPEHLLHYAFLLFQHFTPNPNLFVFNTMISALSFSLTQSISMYKLMLCCRIRPDEHSLLSLLKLCSCLSVTKQIHTHIIVNGFNWHVYLQNSLINMYMVCGKLESAYQVFEIMPLKDVVSYNTMISGYAKKSHSWEAFELFHEMVRSGIELDLYTVVGLLQCCVQLKDEVLGKSVHGLVMRRLSTCEASLVVNNALMGMYAKCEQMRICLKVFEELEKKDSISWNIIISGFVNSGELDIACQYFSKAPIRDLVSWNSLLGGFARKGDWRAMMNFFEKMLAQNVKPDKITSITLVSAASEMGVLDQGRCVHGWVVKAHGSADAFLGSALIDMYCKCGSSGSSLQVFELIKDKDITAWTAMISGLAFHGHGTKALEIFGKLGEGGLVPNFVTLIAVLTACSHSGLVDEGLRIFSNMKQEYGVEPGVEHYGCLVDLLARSGKLNEARDVIGRMPMKPTQSMWGAILSASRAHGDMKLAMEALNKLVVLEPEDDGGYVLLSNVYASCGRWIYSDMVREIMEGRGIKKNTGWSSVVIDGVLHAFVSSDKRHSSWDELCISLCQLHEEMSLLTETM
ncbi:pentatricopeptide repeat-containing protein At3g04750, mitochondrial [Phalaenopsis equestris]|uniref:pentatricopeptide repeat-containing protein At3g04750, mitochondrial n=1 Tax=Phalaenopsis equestris TaxID=78828 RepID=UPI0009E5A9AE|nr:pentatricopeptide repeat-containing protein At3g04750, mitochondrial [Phalaenopsis equestris]XP_020590766.1 pentatricopeptide repeat-containing protein At3g04750, mitochondrial [Phalaenopsis equestris]XP_020590767.1 pentatricopeptide repeat-containing protein At3g04750, mitochondrial [Phalaenopsis equestris]XP_020590768.1 pentatricopeptide repeat-containing protein At3g04750, mitochondrial [Phalaenopsis equestris]